MRSYMLSVSLLGLLTLGSALQARGASHDYQIALEVLRVEGTEHAFDNHFFVSTSTLKDLVGSHRAQLLETVSAAGTEGKNITILSGQKIPLGFTDPRAGGFQVQYVDCGLKAQVKVSQDASGFVVITQSEKMGLEEPGTTGFPYLQGVQVQTQFQLQPGQVALFARTRGQLSRALKLAWPGVNFTDTDTVIFGLSVEAP